MPVLLPTAGGQTPATLYYDHACNLLGGHPLNFLHLIRQVNVFMALGNQRPSRHAQSRLPSDRTIECVSQIGLVAKVRAPTADSSSSMSKDDASRATI